MGGASARELTSGSSQGRVVWRAGGAVCGSRGAGARQGVGDIWDPHREPAEVGGAHRADAAGEVREEDLQLLEALVHNLLVDAELLRHDLRREPLLPSLHQAAG